MDDMGNIVAALRTSPAQTFTNVTFPEGYAVARMGARLEKTVPRLTAANFVAAATSGQIQSELAPGVGNLEGLLFPDSYQIGGSETEAQIVPRLVAADDPGGQQRRHPEAPDPVGRSPYEVLIVASMIEKEAKVDEDRALIARVIYNRLFVGTPLQIDATLYYGQDSSTPFSTLQAHRHAYNTYLHLGLPPTPITNPGKKSIEAALHPAPNPDPATCPGGPAVHLALLRAGGQDDGRHAFATTYEDHLKNVAKARAAGLLGLSPAAPALAISGRTRVAGIIGSPVAPQPLARDAQRRLRGVRSGLALRRLRGPRRRRRRRTGRRAGPRPGRAVGDDAPQGRRRRAGRRAQRHGGGAGCGQHRVVCATGGSGARARTARGFLDTLRLDHGIDPAGMAAVVLGGAGRPGRSSGAGRGGLPGGRRREPHGQQRSGGGRPGRERGRAGGSDDVGGADLLVQATPRRHGRGRHAAGGPALLRPGRSWPTSCTTRRHARCSPPRRRRGAGRWTASGCSSTRGPPVRAVDRAGGAPGRDARRGRGGAAAP